MTFQKNITIIIISLLCISRTTVLGMMRMSPGFRYPVSTSILLAQPSAVGTQPVVPQVAIKPEQQASLQNKLMQEQAAQQIPWTEFQAPQEAQALQAAARSQPITQEVVEPVGEAKKKDKLDEVIKIRQILLDIKRKLTDMDPAIGNNHKSNLIFKNNEAIKKLLDFEAEEIEKILNEESLEKLIVYKNAFKKELESLTEEDTSLNKTFRYLTKKTSQELPFLDMELVLPGYSKKQRAMACFFAPVDILISKSFYEQCPSLQLMTLWHEYRHYQQFINAGKIVVEEPISSQDKKLYHPDVLEAAENQAKSFVPSFIKSKWLHWEINDLQMIGQQDK